MPPPLSFLIYSFLLLLTGFSNRATADHHHNHQHPPYISKRTTTNTTTSNGPTCTDFMIPVTINASNKKVPTTLTSALTTTLTSTTLSNLLNNLGDDLQNALVSGTYNISARYCAPETIIANRTSTIQLLVHGITYTKNYWSGDSFPGYSGTTYSWIDHASRNGYPTLSIDRLGCGNSSHPDPTFVVQVPAQVEAHHQIIRALRSGTISELNNQSFSKIIYVGHSYGSVMGNTLSSRYPADADALVLTGYTSALKPSIPGVVLTGGVIPAALVDTSTFGSLPLGYLATSSLSGRISLFMSPSTSDWDQKIASYDWARQGTVTLGEAVSGLFITDVAKNYTNPVFVLTGHEDQIFCGLSLPALGTTNCGNGSQGYLGKTAELYPNARPFEYLDVPNTGHCLNFHYSANVSFEAAHGFLGRMGF
ncbi:MAG: hypothetical protein M1834_005910 [Cirrosporium novae-zelandiae]|nr:MAG: hypothetical protein M1834_005910 [Cirrosporium novae-zelandiae]